MATDTLRRIRRPGPLTPEEIAGEQAARREVYAEIPSLGMVRYRDLSRKLVRMRRRKEGYESAEEDALLEEMERLWSKLTVEERDVLSHDTPKPLPARGVESKST